MFSQSNENVKLEWMYKGPGSSVERDEYLLGRPIDKSLEQLNEAERQKQLGVAQPKNHVEHECIPPSIRDYNKVQALEQQVDLASKLQEDPLIAIKKRADENRRQFLSNPVQMQKLQKALKAQQKEKKKNKGKRTGSDGESEEDIDQKLKRKLALLKSGNLNSESAGKKRKKMKKRDGDLNTILIHKYNSLKSQLSQDDISDIFAGKVDPSSSDSSSEESAKGDGRKQDSGSRGDYSRQEKIGSRNDKSNKNRQPGPSERLCKAKHSDPGSSREKRCSADRESRNKRHEDRYSSSKKDKFANSVQRKSDRRCRSSSSSDSGSDTKTTHKNKAKGTNIKKQKSFARSNDDASHRKTRNSPKRSKYRKRSSSSSSSSDSSSVEQNTTQKKHRPSEDSDGGSKAPRNYGLVRADGTKLALSKHSKVTENSSDKKKNAQKESTNSSEKYQRARLTDEEKERRRLEMMKNAQWRDEERVKNVRRYREKDAADAKSGESYDAEFLKKELLKSANSSTVESRIKSNINNIQRSHGDMNRHFSRR